MNVGWDINPTRKSLSDKEPTSRFVGVINDVWLRMPATKQKFMVMFKTDDIAFKTIKAYIALMFIVETGGSTVQFIVFEGILSP